MSSVTIVALSVSRLLGFWLHTRLLTKNRKRALMSVKYPTIPDPVVVNFRHKAPVMRVLDEPLGDLDLVVHQAATEQGRAAANQTALRRVVIVVASPSVLLFHIHSATVCCALVPCVSEIGNKVRVEQCRPKGVGRGEFQSGIPS